MKFCKGCSCHKPVSEFSKRKGTTTGLGARCLECTREADRARYLNERDKRVQRNRDKYNASPERYREEVSTYRKKYPSKVAALSSKYRADKIKATPVWADLKQIETYYYTADMLGMHTGEQYHVDHIIPLRGGTVCGLHCQYNLQVLRALDNIKKGNRYEI